MHSVMLTQSFRWNHGRRGRQSSLVDSRYQISYSVKVDPGASQPRRPNKNAHHRVHHHKTAWKQGCCANHATYGAALTCSGVKWLQPLPPKNLTPARGSRQAFHGQRFTTTLESLQEATTRAEELMKLARWRWDCVCASSASRTRRPLADDWSIDAGLPWIGIHNLATRPDPVRARLQNNAGLVGCFQQNIR